MTRAELERAARKSRRTLPTNAAFAMVAAGLLWVLHETAGLPTWAALALGLVSVFGAVGDAINLTFCRVKLRRLEAASRPKPIMGGPSGQ